MTLTYAHRRAIKIEAGKVASNLTNFPLAIHINTASGLTAYDIAAGTPIIAANSAFFTELSSIIWSDNFENYANGAELLDVGTGWTGTNANAASYAVTTSNYLTGTRGVQYVAAAGGLTTGRGVQFSTAQQPAGQFSGAFQLSNYTGNTGIQIKLSTQIATGGTDLCYLYFGNNIGDIQFFYAATHVHNMPATPSVAPVWYTFLIEWRQGATYYEVRCTVTNNSTGAVSTSGLSGDPATVTWLASSVAKATTVNCIRVVSVSNNTAITLGVDDLLVSNTTDYSKRFAVTTPDGTELYIERVTWDDVGQNATLFVTVPTIYAAEDTVLNLWYDKSGSDNTTYVGTTIETPAHSAWPSTHKAVLHLEENPALLYFKDPTVNDSSGTANGGMLAVDSVAGQLDNSISLDGTNDYVSIPSSTALSITSDLTVLISIYIDSVTGLGAIIGKWLETGNNRCWLLKQNAQKLSVWLGDPLTGTLAVQASTTVDCLLPSTWHRVGFRYKAGYVVTLVSATPTSLCVVTFLVAHELLDGDAIIFKSTSDVLPSSIVSGTTYYIKSTGTTTLNLYATEAQALVGGTTGGINIYGQAHSGTHRTSGDIKIFVDGVNKDSSVATGTTVPPYLYSSEWTNVEIGSANSGGLYFFLGRVDEVRIIADAPSPTWINAEYKSIIDELVNIYEEYNAAELIAYPTSYATGGSTFSQQGIPTIYATGGGTGLLTAPVATAYSTGGALFQKTIVPTSYSASTPIYTLAYLISNLAAGRGFIFTSIIPTLTARTGYNIGTPPIRPPPYVDPDTDETVFPQDTGAPNLPILRMRKGRMAMRQDGAKLSLSLSAYISVGNVLTLNAESMRLPLLQMTDARGGSVLNNLSAWGNTFGKLPVFACSGNLLEGSNITSLNRMKLPPLKLTAATSHNNRITCNAKLPYLRASSAVTGGNILTLHKKIYITLKASISNNPVLHGAAKLPVPEVSAFMYANQRYTCAAKLPLLVAGENRIYATNRFDSYILRHIR